MKRKTKIATLLAALFLAPPLLALSGDGTRTAAAGWGEAPRLVHPEKAAIYAATLAGKRFVAVGDYGVVILSDDGKAFRQATGLPGRAPLTSVHFVDERHGWAAGHDGVVLATEDGGENWKVLREERGKDQALLAVWFENRERGFAVGQFGLVVETEDGGKTWKERRLVEEGDAADRHLLSIVPASGGLLLVAAEAGGIFRSEDGGRTWKFIQTDNKGSFWTGAALADGGLLMVGMRGHVYRSDDRGLSWKEVPSGTQQSLTGVVQGAGGGLRVVGMSGAVLSSKDQGRSFEASVRPDRASLTAAVVGIGEEIYFGLAGVMAAR